MFKCNIFYLQEFFLIFSLILEYLEDLLKGKAPTSLQLKISENNIHNNIDISIIFFPLLFIGEKSSPTYKKYIKIK